MSLHKIARAKPQVLIYVCVIAALAIIAHQILFWGRVVDWEQVLQHEFFAAVLIAFAAGIALIVGVPRLPR